MPSAQVVVYLLMTQNKVLSALSMNQQIVIGSRLTLLTSRIHLMITSEYACVFGRELLVHLVYMRMLVCLKLLESFVIGPDGLEKG